MSFWEKNLGAPPAPPPQQTVPTAPPSQRAWWQGEPTQAAQQQTEYVQAQRVDPNTPSDDEYIAHFTSKAKSQRVNSDLCPSCDSGNYLSRSFGKGGVAASHHCFDCGYNEIMGDQLTAVGATGGGGEGVSRTVQTAGGGLVNTFSPATEANVSQRRVKV